MQVLGQEDIKPHKVRYYLERRDAEFEQKMAQVLCVYREVQVRFQSAAAWFKTKYNSLAAASSDGKWPLVLMARRSLEFSASMAFVV